MSDNDFVKDFHKYADKITCKYDNFMFLADLNFDCLMEEKSKNLKNLLDVYDLSNLLKEPTCFAKGSKPSLVDVILTNKPSYCGNTCKFDCGISDVHNIIAVQFKTEILARCNTKRTYRSYKNLMGRNLSLIYKMLTFKLIVIMIQMLTQHMMISMKNVLIYIINMYL